ncbi:MAG: hypothetical protein K2M17_02940, partial [Bacilli bacterium]|nr:hypothetical protein [Bacilli bacterium]
IIDRSEYMQKETVIFPHRGKYQQFTKDFYQDLDLFFAEVSFPATGLGIELGWAYDEKDKIYCFYRQGCKISRSLTAVTNHFIEYKDAADMLNKMEEIVRERKVK